MRFITGYIEIILLGLEDFTSSLQLSQLFQTLHKNPTYIIHLGSVCFTIKYFLENIFNICGCLFRCKILVKLKIVSVDRKMLC